MRFSLICVTVKCSTLRTDHRSTNLEGHPYFEKPNCDAISPMPLGIIPRSSLIDDFFSSSYKVKHRELSASAVHSLETVNIFFSNLSDFPLLVLFLGNFVLVFSLISVIAVYVVYFAIANMR